MFLLCVPLLTQSFIDLSASRTLSLSFSCVSFFEIANAPISSSLARPLTKSTINRYRNHIKQTHILCHGTCVNARQLKNALEPKTGTSKNISTNSTVSMENSTTRTKDQTWNVVVRRTKRANIYESFKLPG